MRGSFEILAKSSKEIEKFFSYGAHYIRFVLDYTHVDGLMFGNVVLNVSICPDLKALSTAAFDGLVRRLKLFMPDLMRQTKIL